MLLELIIIMGTIGVISAKNPVHSILFLILVFLNTAMLLISLGIDFLGIFLIIVYVGAIAILFLFVVMLISIKPAEFKDDLNSACAFFFGVLFLFVFELFVLSDYNTYSLSSSISWINELYGKGNNLIHLGILLYTIYLPYLMVAAIILLVAMLGVIILTFPHGRVAGSLRQSIYQQNSSYLNNNLFY